MEQILTGKCKEDFEKWWNNKFEKQPSSEYSDYVLEKFYSFGIGLKWGVYQDFFDEKEDDYKKRMFPKVTKGLDVYFTTFRGNLTQFKTRSEARIKAVKQANIYYNERL